MQVATKEAASGTERAATARKQLVDLEQRLEAASQREAVLKADTSKVCMPSWALPWHGQACCRCHIAGACRDARKACLALTLLMHSYSDLSNTHAGVAECADSHEGMCSEHASAEEALTDA